MNSEILGESSSKRHETDDKMDADRPLKKARFAWEVKGKYHLKNRDNGCLSNFRILPKNNSTLDSDNEHSSDESSEDSEEEILAGNAEQNLEILGDYLLKQDFNSLNNTSNSHNEKSERNEPSKILTAERCTLQKAYNNSMNESQSQSRDSFSMVDMDRPRVEDQCLARWQARQMAKGFVDNTINRVLDSWLVSPFPVTTENESHPALEVAEFLDNLPANNNIENEGILMAISAHGLQNNVLRSNSDVDIQPKQSLCSKSAYDKSSTSQSSVFGSSKSYPLGWNKEERPCTCDNRIKNTLATTEVKPLLPFHHRNQPDRRNYFIDCTEPSQESREFIVRENTQCENRNEENKDVTPNNTESNRTSDESIDSNLADEFDFMDAAVSFAIQNKGLTSFENDYG